MNIFEENERGIHTKIRSHFLVERQWSSQDWIKPISYFESSILRVEIEQRVITDTITCLADLNDSIRSWMHVHGVNITSSTVYLQNWHSTSFEPQQIHPMSFHSIQWCGSIHRHREAQHRRTWPRMDWPWRRSSVSEKHWTSDQSISPTSFPIDVLPVGMVDSWSAFTWAEKCRYRSVSGSFTASIRTVSKARRALLFSNSLESLRCQLIKLMSFLMLMDEEKQRANRSVWQE